MKPGKIFEVALRRQRGGRLDEAERLYREVLRLYTERSLRLPASFWCCGLSIATHLGLPELIAHSPDDYVLRAVELSADLHQLATLRRGLRGRMEASPLMDAPRFARDLEAGYREMWRAWCAPK